MPSVSICIVNWNTGTLLRDCIASIDRFSEKVVSEIIIVDNASQDNSIALAKADFPEIKIIRNTVNEGFARANNRAFRQCSSRFVLILNPDIRLTSPVLKSMISQLEDLPGAGMVGPKLRNPDGSIQESCFNAFPGLLREWRFSWLLDRLFQSFVKELPVPSRPVECAWLAGACLLIRREILLKMDGFDPRFFMYSEDADLSYRLRSLGLKTWYLPQLEMYHYHAASSVKKKRHYFSWILQRESRYQFIRKHHGLFAGVLFRLIWLTGGLLRAVLAYIPAGLFSERSRMIGQRYLHVLFWSLGFERWAADPGKPD